MAVLIRTFDWTSTPLGPLERRPQSLRSVVALLLRSAIPIVLLWGTDGVMIYNDAYSVFAGRRHPRLLGSKVREGWPEVAAFNDNVMTVGLAGGTLAYKDQELTLYRTGKAEQVWMNLDYSPVLDDSNRPAGVIAIVIETTQRVLADRRIALEQKRQRQMLDQMPGFGGLGRTKAYLSICQSGLHHPLGTRRLHRPQRTGSVSRSRRTGLLRVARHSLCERRARRYARHGIATPWQRRKPIH